MRISKHLDVDLRALWTATRIGLKSQKHVCRFAEPANSPFAAVMTRYLDAVRLAKAPKPVPPYVESHGWQANQRRKSDLSFSLLQLFAGQLADDSAADMQDLLTPECHTPEPLNTLFTWLLLQALKAIGAVGASQAVLSQVGALPLPPLSARAGAALSFPGAF